MLADSRRGTGLRRGARILTDQAAPRGHKARFRTDPCMVLLPKTGTDTVNSQADKQNSDEILGIYREIL